VVSGEWVCESGPGEEDEAGGGIKALAMRILVTFAVEAEFAPWRKLRNLCSREMNGITVHEAKIGRATVDFVVSGMGMENAQKVTAAVLSKSHDFCIAAGFAGALRPEYKPGTIVVSEAVQLIGKSKTLACGRGLVLNACRDGAVRAKLLLTSDHIVRTAEEKSQLAPFADSVDMESFGVLSAAQKCSRPAVAIRVISDSYDTDLPVDLEMIVDDKRKVRIGRVLHYLGRHPIHIPALIRLGRESRSAAAALANFLEAHIKKLSFYTHGWFPEGEGLEEVAAR
jgi:adenosylhomocysteine nucleosidase